MVMVRGEETIGNILQYLADSSAISLPVSLVTHLIESNHKTPSNSFTISCPSRQLIDLAGASEHGNDCNVIDRKHVTYVKLDTNIIECS